MFDGLYTVESIVPEEGHVVADVRLNPEHAIFAGHFPGNPVVPGVCSIQMIKDTVALGMSRKVLLVDAPSIKFVAGIDPRESPLVRITAECDPAVEGRIAVRATVTNAGKTFVKFQGAFVIVAPAEPGQ